MKWAVAFWVGISLFLAVLLAVPPAYRGLVWIPYAPLLVWAIVACNRGQQKFRDAQTRTT